MTFLRIISLVVLIINLICIHLVATPKRKIWEIIAFNLGLTIVINMIPIVFPNFNSPDWVILLYGLLYIIPMLYNYDLRFYQLMAILLFCLTQTMTITAILINIEETLLSLPEVFKILFHVSGMLILTPLVIHFLRKTYKLIVNNLRTENIVMLMSISFAFFILAIFMRYFMIPLTITTLMIKILFLLLFYLVFRLIYMITKKSINLHSLSTLVGKDSLTGICNRYSLFKNNEVFEKGEKFSLYFLDLDNFKDINDLFGHEVGDRYLIAFVDAVLNSITDQDKIYRLAGDEFVCIVYSDTLTVESFQKNIEDNFNFIHKFKGVSIGVSSYPEDGITIDALLLKSDNKMYKDKETRSYRT